MRRLPRVALSVSRIGGAASRNGGRRRDAHPRSRIRHPAERGPPPPADAGRRQEPEELVRLRPQSKGEAINYERDNGKHSKTQ